MCEVHFYKCTCGYRWSAHKKLASCESGDPDIRCPDNLCMVVGNIRKPQKGECDSCRDVREVMEYVDDEIAG